jgi:hypothetical protein
MTMFKTSCLAAAMSALCLIAWTGQATAADDLVRLKGGFDAPAVTLGFDGQVDTELTRGGGRGGGHGGFGHGGFHHGGFNHGGFARGGFYRGGYGYGGFYRGGYGYGGFYRGGYGYYPSYYSYYSPYYSYYYPPVPYYSYYNYPYYPYYPTAYAPATTSYALIVRPAPSPVLPGSSPGQQPVLPGPAPGPGPGVPSPIPGQPTMPRAEGSFPYDGGPANPVPLPPSADQGPLLQPQSLTPPRPWEVSLPPRQPQLRYPAYGEQPRPASPVPGTYLVGTTSKTPR